MVRIGTCIAGNSNIIVNCCSNTNYLSISYKGKMKNKSLLILIVFFSAQLLVSCASADKCIAMLSRGKWQSKNYLNSYFVRHDSIQIEYDTVSGLEVSYKIISLGECSYYLVYLNSNQEILFARDTLLINVDIVGDDCIDVVITKKGNKKIKVKDRYCRME